MNRTQPGRRTSRALVLLAATAIIAAACGSDSNASNATTAASPAGTTPAATTPAATTPAATTPATTAPAGSAAPATSAAVATNLDTNGDGKVVFGIAAAGPADDGAYYQAVVDAAKKISTENGFADPIVVDNIQAADAATAIGDLAQQGVDVIIVGASEIAEPLPQLIAQYPDIFWYCNCGAGFPPNPGLVAEHRRRRRDQLHGRVRNRVEAEGEGRRFGGDHRLLRPRLREAGVHGVRSRPEGCRSVVHLQLRADRRLPVRLRQHGQRHGRLANRHRQRRRRRLPVPRWRPPPGRAGRQRCRVDHDERRIVEGL